MSLQDERSIALESPTVSVHCVPLHEERSREANNSILVGRGRRQYPIETKKPFDYSYTGK